MYNKKVVFIFKIILLVFFIIALIFLSFNIANTLAIVKSFYNKHIGIYPLWQQILVLFFPFFLYFVVIQIMKNRCKYKEDIIYGVKWTWDWHKKDITNIYSFCPVCNEELYYEDNSLQNDNLKMAKIDLICGNCNKVLTSIPKNKNISRSFLNIKKEIERVIKKRLLEKK